MPLTDREDPAELFRLLMDNVREYAVFVTDLDGLVIEWNAGAERVLGYTGDEAVGMAAAAVFTDEDRAAGVPEREMAEAAGTGNAMDDRWHVRKGGARFWANGVLTALRYPPGPREGEVRGFVKILRDNTAQKEAADALRQAKARAERQFRAFATALDAVEDFVYLFDTDGRFTYVNRPLLDLWGLKFEEAVGKGFAEIGYPPDLVDLHRRQIAEVVRTGRPLRGDNAYVAPNGSEGHYEYIFSPVHDEGGAVAAVAGVTRDVTDRRRAEAALAESERRFRAVFSQAPAFIAVLRGPGHRFEFVNPAYVRLVGDRALVGLPVREALPEIEGQGFFELLDRVYGGGEPYTAVDQPVLLRRAEGRGPERRYVDFVYEPLREQDGTVSGVIALGVDTTARVEAREELARTNQELEGRVEDRTRQVRALGARLSVAEQDERRRLAHVLHDDLQQRLYGLGITLSLLRRHCGEGEAADLHGRAVGALGQATALTRSLAVELSPAVLETDRLADVLRWLAGQKREVLGLEVEVEGDADVGDSGLRTLLYHLVRELLFNVAKHAGTGRARVVIDDVDGAVSVRVEDEGSGFDPSTLETAALEASGADGFGLSSVRERLELVGGRLDVDSAPGVGTQVTITVPRGDHGEA